MRKENSIQKSEDGMLKLDCTIHSGAAIGAVKTETETH
jgi:hypothetical protein